jgi:hypothetical protein
VILTRILWLFAAIAAVTASAAIAVFALAFAFFALLRPYLGPPGAAAAVMAAFALAVILFGLLAANLAKPPKPRRRRKDEPADLADKIAGLAKDKPLTAAGAAAALGLVALGNPRLFGGFARSFLEGWEGRSSRRKKTKD